MSDQTASTEEFRMNTPKLPGDRAELRATGKYILELYINPFGDQSLTIIQVSEKTKNGNYLSVDNLKFEEEDSARDVFSEMVDSEKSVEEQLN